ncbi:MAG: hypothetical protein HUJ63_12855 [Enterococcus sp.]|nr:hypothetical protein [Enterococcus sp.]
MKETCKSVTTNVEDGKELNNEALEEIAGGAAIYGRMARRQCLGEATLIIAQAEADPSENIKVVRETIRPSNEMEKIKKIGVNPVTY